MRSKNTPRLLTRSVTSRRWARATLVYTARLSISGTPVVKVPLTTTSMAFMAPSVVLASRVRLLPGVALRLRARASPNITSGSVLSLVSTAPEVTVKNGPFTANSLSGSTPVAIITVDLSPLLMSPLNTTLGSTWRTAGSASSSWRSASTLLRPCCRGTSSSVVKLAGVPSTRWPVSRAAAWASAWYVNRAKPPASKMAAVPNAAIDTVTSERLRLRSVFCRANLNQWVHPLMNVAMGLFAEVLIEFSRPTTPPRGRSGGSGGCRGWQ